MKNITIIPYVRNISLYRSKKLAPTKLDVAGNRPFKLKVDDSRTISIKNYFFDGDYLIVRYTENYSGIDIPKGSFGSGIYVQQDGINPMDNWDVNVRQLVRKYNDNNMFTGIFKIDKSKDIMIGAYDVSDVTIMKDKSVTVKIKQ